MMLLYSVQCTYYGIRCTVSRHVLSRNAYTKLAFCLLWKGVDYAFDSTVCEQIKQKTKLFQKFPHIGAIPACVPTEKLKLSQNQVYGFFLEPDPNHTDSTGFRFPTLRRLKIHVSYLYSVHC